MAAVSGATAVSPVPLSASSLRCACVVHSLSLMAQVVSQWKNTHKEEGVIRSCLCLVFDPQQW